MLAYILYTPLRGRSRLHRSQPVLSEPGKEMRRAAPHMRLFPPNPHAQYHSPHPVGLGTRPNTSTISIVQCPAVCLNVCNFCDVYNAVSPGRHNRHRISIVQRPWLAETSAMSIMRSVPTGMTGIANVWSNFGQFSKNIEKHSISRRKMRPPPKLKLRIYLAGFLAIYTSLHNALGTSGAGGFYTCVP